MIRSFLDVSGAHLTPETWAWLDQGKFQDSKTLIALYWLRCQPR